jgi:hypothetical protein
MILSGDFMVFEGIFFVDYLASGNQTWICFVENPPAIGRAISIGILMNHAVPRKKGITQGFPP